MVSSVCCLSSFPSVTCPATERHCIDKKAHSSGMFELAARQICPLDRSMCRRTDRDGYRWKPWSSLSCCGLCTHPANPCRLLDLAGTRDGSDDEVRAEAEDNSASSMHGYSIERNGQTEQREPRAQDLGDDVDDLHNLSRNQRPRLVPTRQPTPRRLSALQSLIWLSSA